MKNKIEVLKYGKRMLSDGLVKANWGNISKLEENRLFITPSGMDYDSLEIEDIVEIDFSDGEIINGCRKPSSELIMHSEIYKKRPDIKGIVHTHSIYASAFSVVRKGILPYVEDMIQIAGGDIRIADYALPGSAELAQNAIDALIDRNACILSNHGLIAIGRSLEEAYKVALIVEKAAQIAAIASGLGSPVALSQEDVKTMRQYYLESYGQK